LKDKTPFWQKSKKQEEWGHERLQEQKEEEKELSPLTKRILIVDEDPDVTLTFKAAFKEANRINGNRNFFQVQTYNDPVRALSEFKPDLYDLMLVDINMPKMNGFEFALKIMEVDANPRICFMSSGLINQEALREQYPLLSVGCFIGKPVSMENLVKRVKAELE
jgi:two-component system catabolic regulation response regulator CreB/two-component system response regulator ChvI